MFTYGCSFSRIHPEESETDVIIIDSQSDRRWFDSEVGSDRGLGVFEHLPGLLVGAFLLQTLPLQISHLQLLQPARVIPPGPDQDAMSSVWIQKHFQTKKEEFSVIAYKPFKAKRVLPPVGRFAHLTPAGSWRS